MRIEKDKTDENTLDSQVSKDLENLKILLGNETNLYPDAALDKQIFAAAHREMEEPLRPKTYKLSFWRKLSLPLYIVSGFMLTAFAYKALWYAPVITPVGSDETATIITIESDSAEKTIVEPEIPVEKRALPEPTAPVPMPERIITQSEKSQPTSKHHLTSDSLLIKQGIYTGSELSKSTYPEKEAWVRSIINHLKEGNNETAKNELVRFKKAYPDYPIEEQIKVLSQ